MFKKIKNYLTDVDEKRILKNVHKKYSYLTIIVIFAVLLSLTIILLNLPK